MTVHRILETKGREVITSTPDRSLRDLAVMLAEKRIGAVAVTDAGGTVLGIISERDIVRAVARAGAAALDAPISSHMTQKVISCTPDTTVETIMEAMTRGHFRHMPVMDGGRLAGFISINDVVKHRLAEMEGEQKALREYITSA